jgi:hypothetical protein
VVYLVLVGCCGLYYLGGFRRHCLVAAASCCLGGWLHPSFFLGGLLQFILSRWVAVALSRGCSLVLSRRVAAAF